MPGRGRDDDATRRHKQVVAARGAERSPILHVVGARPNFMKAAPVIDALAERGVHQRVVHTGQHYDDRLSDVFFAELGLPKPDVNLGVGSSTHIHQTAQIMLGLEGVFDHQQPRLVVVYGDVNSTLAAALAARQMNLPLAHVEAGLRSFDATMPEETNRRLADLLSDVLFVTSPEGIDHLSDDGVDPSRVHFVGNPMIDSLLRNLDRFDAAAVRATYGLPQRYAVATLHRPANVDAPEAAQALVKGLHATADLLDVIIPLHPRGREQLSAAGLGGHERVQVIDPLGYLEFVSLVKGAALVVTDSGGVQEETTVLGVPCLTLRPNTERPITITHGTNRLVTVASLPAAAKAAVDHPPRPATSPPLWDGQAGQRIAGILAAAPPAEPRR